MRDLIDQGTAVSALRQALPYLLLHRDQVFVVKVGGALFQNPAMASRFLEQICVIHTLGIRVLLVHGGGEQTTKLCEERGITPEFVGGRRVTDDQVLDCASMAINGQVRTQCISILRKHGVKAIGLSGADAGLISAKKRPSQVVDGENLDYGLVGDIEKIDLGILDSLWERGHLPLVSPMSMDDSGQLLNINADTVAASLAAELGAAKLIFATGAPGILEDLTDPSTLISYLDLGELKELANAGVLAAGMLPKVAAAQMACEQGVARVHIVSYKSEDTVLAELFTNEGAGTLIVAHKKESTQSGSDDNTDQIATCES